MTKPTKRGRGKPATYGSAMDERVTWRIPEAILVACRAAAKRAGIPLVAWARASLAEAAFRDAARGAAPGAAAVDSAENRTPGA